MALHLRETAILLTGWLKGSYQSTLFDLPAYGGTDRHDGDSSSAGHKATAVVTANLPIPTLPRPAGGSVTHSWKIINIWALPRNV